MAPYALTPTIERGELTESNWSPQITSLQTEFSSNGSPTFSSGSSNVNGESQHHTNGVNGHSSTHAESPVLGATYDTHTPNSTTSSEDAYIHGYRDGFSKAHIELKHQPIAIIGMSCRLPGSVSTPDEFWELLARSRTGFSPIPPSRFSANRFHHPNPGKSGATNAKGGNCA